MKTYEIFSTAFGRPLAGTGVDLAHLGLDHSDALWEFASEVGGGAFGGGLLSVLSVREQVTSLEEWEHWLPGDSRLFGSGAFGFLMTTRGRDVWLVDTQYGQVIESNLTIAELLNELATLEGRDEDLRAPLFDLWNRMTGPLDPRSVLCPVPALPLGGQWAATTLSVMSLPVYLSFTGQIFAPGSNMPADVRRLAPA